MKFDWIGNITPYQGAKVCKSSTYWIEIQIAAVVVQFFVAAAQPYASRLWSKRSKNEVVPLWSLPTEYSLQTAMLVASLAGELLAIFLSVVAMKQSGAGVFVTNEGKVVWNLFVLFALRPRSAPFIGLLGFFQGWSDSALADIVIDGVLVIIAGFYWTIHYFSYAWSPDIHPQAPNAQLKLLGIGALISVAPPFLWWIAGVVYLVILAGVDVITGLVSNTRTMVGVIILGLALPFLVMLFAPLFAIFEVLMIIRLLFVRLRKPKYGFHKHRSIAWKPLRVGAKYFRPSYALLVFLSFAINVGAWMFYSLFITLQGDLFCPSGSAAISAILILVPKAVTLPLQIVGKMIE